MQVAMNGRLSGMNYTDAAKRKSRQSATEEWIQMLAEATKNGEGTEDGSAAETGSADSVSRVRSEAAKIYEAAGAGKENPIGSIRQAPKVPYGYLAEGGVIEYNGVCFVCDEKTNSICLGDVSDPAEVITVALSDGGHLKVNRDNLGDLSKAVGMFSPEDLNRIMRAIAQDTKIQSMKREIEDMEDSVGNVLGTESAETDGTRDADGDK